MSFVYGATDLRALCRTMGVIVSFGGVSTYSDNGEPIKGLFDRPMQLQLMDQGAGGAQTTHPELRLPYNAFNVMPKARDSVAVIDPVTLVSTTYVVMAPTTEEDGAFLCYELKGP